MTVIIPEWFAYVLTFGIAMLCFSCRDKFVIFKLKRKLKKLEDQ